MLLGRSSGTDSNLSRHMKCPAPDTFKAPATTVVSAGSRPFRHLQVIEYAEPMVLTERLTVTCFDANHCPGSLMLLFEGVTAAGDAVRDCCTGDARFEEGMMADLADVLNHTGALPIDHLYLDTTFCMEEFIQFDPIHHQAEAVCRCLEQHRRIATQHVYLDCSMIGSEVVLMAVAEAVAPAQIEVTPLRFAELEVWNRRVYGTSQFRVPFLAPRARPTKGLSLLCGKQVIYGRKVAARCFTTEGTPTVHAVEGGHHTPSAAFCGCLRCTRRRVGEDALLIKPSTLWFQRGNHSQLQARHEVAFPRTLT